MTRRVLPRWIAAMTITLCVSGALQAEPLRIVDVEDLAEQAGPYVPRIGQQQVGPLPDGTLVTITRAGDISLCDPGPGPAFGSAVIDIMQAQMLIRECPELSSPTIADRLDALRDLALPRYAELVDAWPRTVRRAYSRALDGMRLPVACDSYAETWVGNWTSDRFEADLRQSMIRDRLPSYACTRSVFID